MDAVQNARLIANAEQYYRIMYYGSRASWNLRDSHMFDTLETLLAFYRPKARAGSSATRARRRRGGIADS
jgi:erythromycin esterase-like protein